MGVSFFLFQTQHMLLLPKKLLHIEKSRPKILAGHFC